MNGKLKCGAFLLVDIDEILSYAWKEKTYVSDSYLNLLNGTRKTIEQLFTTK
jgi:hypothetical protein